MNTNLPVIAGIEITTDAEGRFNLNALHRASGEGDHKAPNKWMRKQQVKELIAELESQTPNLASGGAISISNGGTNPGTFAHKLLAISYAGWISPRFQLHVNQVFLDAKEGRSNDDIAVNHLATLHKYIQLGRQAEAQLAVIEARAGVAVEEVRTRAQIRKDPRKPRIRQLVREGTQRPHPATYVGPSLYQRIENIPDTVMTAAELGRYATGGEWQIWHSLWEVGAFTWDGVPTADHPFIASFDGQQFRFHAHATLHHLRAKPNRNYC